jgi:16S rRNA (cytosine967-C5)-methyltransferase
VASASGDRQRAARLLIRVEQGAFAGRLLDDESAAGVRVRVLGVLRWQRALDAALSAHLMRPIDRLDPEIRAVLRLGAFEIAHLGVPRPVATDAAVRLTRRLGRSSAAGLANAVLRRVADATPREPPDLALSHPEWTWQRWRHVFGDAEAEAAMAAAQAPAPAWVWFVDEDARADVEAGGVVLRPHPWCPGTWTADSGQATLMAAVAGGRAFAQDPSSQMVAHVAREITKGRGRAVDLCAAPGGKTALLGRLGSWRELVASDLDPVKVARLRRRLAGVGLDLVVAGDAAQPPFAAGIWDLVLLDAPCSGTGTFRRHPELKWRLTPDAVGEAAVRQRPMVTAALGLLGRGGVLVYATCSVEPEENEAHFETVPRGFELVDLGRHLPPGLPWRGTPVGGVRILPHDHGDGFTIHAVRRSAPDSVSEAS